MQSGRIFVQPAKAASETDEIMINATYLEAHLSKANLLKNRLLPSLLGAPKSG
jgi:hypothetical protein